jgi:hypothetical protein
MLSGNVFESAVAVVLVVLVLFLVVTEHIIGGLDGEKRCPPEVQRLPRRAGAVEERVKGAPEVNVSSV